MGDLVSGRYPDSEQEWMLDGMPYPPYRRTISRGDICTSSISLASATMYVFPVPCQAGDVIGAITALVKTATGTPTHSWAALYSGVGASAVLLAQSADVPGGWPGGAAKVALQSAVLVGGIPGTPQGAGAASPGSGGPVVLGLAIYASGGATLFDGMIGSTAAAGAVAVTGQLPLASSVAVAATATAPATLAGIAAASTGIPYAVLSQS